jgi:hypothetical protein
MVINVDKFTDINNLERDSKSYHEERKSIYKHTIDQAKEHAAKKELFKQGLNMMQEPSFEEFMFFSQIYYDFIVKVQGWNSEETEGFKPSNKKPDLEEYETTSMYEKAFNAWQYKTFIEYYNFFKAKHNEPQAN